MAETVINTMVQLLVEKLIGVAAQEFNLVLGFKNELKRLKKSLEMTRAFLHDASKRKLQDEAVKLWLKNLEDVAYDADNLLDEFNYEILRRKVHIENQMKKKVCSFLAYSNPLGFRMKMAHKIKDVNMKLKMVNEEATSHGLQKIVADSVISLPHVIETDSISFDPIVIGREKDVSNIVNMFIEQSNELISVIPIVGMGGLGKTTLARLIFNNQRTLTQFDERIWVCVSENFDTTGLQKRILESLTKHEVPLESKEAIIQSLRANLGTKRYLVVIDDLWNDNRKQWEDFERCLNGINDTIGNFVLLTTRRKDIASIVNSETNYVLDGLSDGDCWSIIKARTFPKREVPQEFETVGLKIAGKCRGLPLAANMVGGTLRGKGLGDWTSLLESGFSDTNVDANEVLQVLRVSFDRLPSLILKKCFAYCSVFRKDEYLERERLIQLWMAEGFLIENHESDMESMGDTVFDILLHSSFFLEIEEESFLNIKHYKMHDLVHDLACLVSKTESFNDQDRIPDRIPRVRYLMMKSLDEGAQKIIKQEAFYLRTLFWDSNVPDEMFKELKHLRVLDVSRTNIENLTASIDKLIHLRFLSVSFTKIKALPESICKLYHLQTLIITGCWDLKELPNKFHNLVSLRHLFMGYIKMPLEIGKLTCLRTLEFFQVGGEKGLQIEELQFLKNLKGRVQITNLELVNNKDEALKANLMEKPNIHKLNLCWSFSFASLDNNTETERVDNNHEKVLEGLQPHPNIKSLSIEGFNGDKFPSWTTKMTTIGGVKLNNLSQINLTKCTRSQEIPTLGHLPLLERLELSMLENLKSIGPSFYYLDNSSQSRIGSTVLFPALKHFRLFWMKNLVQWVGPAEEESHAEMGGISAFPRLENLEITDCLNMITAPRNDFPSLQTLTVEKMYCHYVLERMCTNKLTSLVHLTISKTPALNCVSESAFYNKPCLEYLKVSKCPNLTHFGFSDDVYSLKSLTIKSCDNLIEISYSSTQSKGLSCLENLQIQYCDQLSILPISEMLQSCASLKYLAVHGCGNLTSLPIDFKKMPCLLSLTMLSLPQLTNLPEGIGSLTMLEFLDIGGFSIELGFTLLSEMLEGIKGLQNLRKLSVSGCWEWGSLPEPIQNLTALTSLKIEFFGIEALPDWIWNLSSLVELKIAHCVKLTRRPSEEDVQRLTKLRFMRVIYSPLVEELDWMKI